MNSQVINAGPTGGAPSESPVLLHPLVYLPQDDEVTVGRQDVDSYCIMSSDAAEVLRQLEAGATPREAADRYEAAHAQSLDINAFLAGLGELGFIRAPDEPRTATDPVRWKRLGAAAFSRPAWIIYVCLILAALIATLRRPDLMPSYHHLFFTDYYAAIQATLFAAGVPLLLLHESFHALAGRRLGLRSRMTIGRRLYFVVLETAMDGLVAVPRRQRYLPILAGILADVIVVAALTIAADITREPSGSFSFEGRICLAIALTVWLRIVWQFSFYLRTDLYVLLSTALGCVNLHMTAKELIVNRLNRLVGRRNRLFDESKWHPVDRKAARWYSWLVFVGYTVTIAMGVLFAGPICVQMVTGVIGRFTGGGHAWHELVDSAVVTAVLMVQFIVFVSILVKERRRKQRRLHHVIA